MNEIHYMSFLVRIVELAVYRLLSVYLSQAKYTVANVFKGIFHNYGNRVCVFVIL